MTSRCKPASANLTTLLFKVDRQYKQDTDGRHTHTDGSAAIADPSVEGPKAPAG